MQKYPECGRIFAYISGCLTEYGEAMFPSDNRNNEMFVGRSINRSINIILIIIITLWAHTAYGKIKSSKSSTYARKQSVSSRTPSIRQQQPQLQSAMKKYLGTPYELGGTGSDGIDCSGFSRLIYKKVYGVDLPHNAASQSKCPPSLLRKVPLENLKAGDLIFFSSSARNKKNITHVGLYLSDGEFIHASRGKKSVVISDLNADNWRSKVVSTKRLSSLDPWDEWQSAHSSGISLAGNKKNKLSLSYKKTVKRSPTAAPGKYAALYYRDQFNDLEFQYIKTLRDNTWNVTVGAFQQQALIADGRTLASAYPVPMGQLVYDGHFTSAYNQGVRMSSDIKPVNWLNIMPSITYFNHGPEMQKMELPRRAMGVDVNLVPPDSTWSLSTAVQYANYKQSGVRELNYNNKDLAALDMSFRYRQQVNDRLDFTVVGQHIQKSNIRTEDYLDNNKADQRLSLQLNFMY